MTKRSRAKTYNIHCWNHDGEMNEEEVNASSAEDSETSKTEEENDMNSKIANPEEEYEEAFYDDVLDMVCSFVGIQHAALNHVTNKTIVHESPFKFDATYLEIIPEDKKVQLTKKQKTSPLQYVFIREKERYDPKDENTCVTLDEDAEWIAGAFEPAYRASHEQNAKDNAGKESNFNPPYDPTMLDIVSIRLKSSKTNIESIMSLRNMIRQFVADPPLDFFYAIGFLGEAVVLTK